MIRVTKHYFLPFNDRSCFTIVTLMSRDKGLDALKIHGMVLSLSSCRFSTKETKILLITFNKTHNIILKGERTEFATMQGIDFSHTLYSSYI